MPLAIALVDMITFASQQGEGEQMPTTKAKPAVIRDTWRVYQTMFSDHLEASNMAPMTIRTYMIAVSQLGEFLRATGMPTDPTSVTREHLVEWMRFLQRPREDGGKHLTAQTALQRYRSVSRLFAWLVDTDEIKESPFAKMKPPRVPEKLVPVIEEDYLRRLLKICSGTGFEERRDKAIISLFIDTGLRISEMAALKVGDVDTEERELVVLGKGRRRRLLRFVKDTRSDINRYFLIRSRHPHADEAALWLGKRGGLQANGIYQMVQRRCAEAGVPAVHPHQFRHTFAHMYLKGGGKEGDLMQVTGWRSRQMVDRYGASVASARAASAHDEFSPRRAL
jgi:site-specific recombinase XerC